MFTTRVHKCQMASSACIPVEILQSWGVASARHTSGTLVHPEPSNLFGSYGTTNDPEYLYDVPIGLSVVRWDLMSKKRLMQFQAHSDLVTCTRKSPDGTLIASSSYNGDVRLWTAQWECMDSIRGPEESHHHLAWSQDSKRFLVVGSGRNSSMMVYDICNEDSKMKLKVAWVLYAKDCISIQRSELNTDKDSNVEDPDEKLAREIQNFEFSGKQYPYEDFLYLAEINPTGNMFVVLELPYKTALVHVVSSQGEIIKTEDLMMKIQDENRIRRQVNVIIISSYHDGMYAVGVEGGRIVLMDAESLEVISMFKVGSGFRTCMWDGDNLVLPFDSGEVTWWNRSGKKVAEFVSCMQDAAVHMSWSASGKGMWICTFSLLAYFNVERDKNGLVTAICPTMEVHCHDITSVGVGFSPSGRMLGSGDLVGTVWVSEKDAVSPLHKCSVTASVRCLTWMTEETMLIGTLDGNVHMWNVKEPQPMMFLQLEGNIINMQFNHQYELLAVGTSKGILAVFRVVKELKEIVRMNAHLPQPGPQDQRFGQLGKQAEIWSLCWSPTDSKLATCSEDQTVKVWDTQSWKCITTLRGHSLAVTCVDWKQHERWSLLASCSDDRSVRLMNGETYELLAVVTTEDVYGWHTITYLALYPNKDSLLLLSTTQNGHLVIWSVQFAAESDGKESKCLLQRRWKGKLHLGSVEGLAWQDMVDEGSIATVGGDCVVNLFKIVL